MELIGLVLLPLLAFLATFRGWGFLPFALLIIPFAPDLADVFEGGKLTLPDAPNPLALGGTVAALVAMTLKGRS
jgi:hypothetical protein